GHATPPPSLAERPRSAAAGARLSVPGRLYQPIAVILYTSRITIVAMETQITLVFRPKNKSVTAIQHETPAINAPTTNGSPTASVNSAPRTYFRRKNSPKVLTNVRNWIVIPTCAHRSLVSLTIADARPLLPPNARLSCRGRLQGH